MGTAILRQTDTFTFDDVVLINGIKGWVNFIGSDVLQLIDDKNKDYLINIKDLKEVYILRPTVLEGSLSIFNWKQAQINAN